MSRCAGEPGGARSDVAGVESRLTRATSAFSAGFSRRDLCSSRTLSIRSRSFCRAARCNADRRFSFRKALESSAERAQAGRWRAVMQALGHRVGWQSVIGGILRSRRSASGTRRRWVEEAVGKDADMKSCERGSQHSAKSATVGDHAGKGRSSSAAASSVRSTRAALRDRRARRRSDDHRNRRACPRSGRGGAPPRLRRGIPSGWSRHNLRRLRPRRACTGSCRRWCRMGG